VARRTYHCGMQPWPGTHRASIALWLEAHGYRIQQRQHVWHECLIEGSEDGWVGVGTSAEQAFENALTRAFPTCAARMALIAASGVLPGAPALAQLEGPRSPQPAESSPPLPPEPEVPAAQASPVVEASVPRALEAGPEREFAPGTPRATLRAPRLPRERALELGQEILDSIAAGAGEIAVWSPERQRLAILIWIARARDVQSSNGEREVKDLVHACARELGLLSARWWPGSVTALQEAAYPAECARELELGRAPESWSEVAEAAEQALASREAAEEAEGADEDGWWDAAALEPAHPEPAAALRECVRKLEGATGALTLKPRDVQASSLGAEERLRLAKTARWIREAAGDVATLGDVLGRLRWLAWKERDRDLAGWLDPHRAPRTGWARELGFDPEKSARRERRKAVLRSLPAADAPLEPAELIRWLGAAFECPELDVARLTSLLRPFASVALALPTGKETWPERRQRTRLARVQELLAAAPADLPERERVLSEELADSSEESAAVPLAPPRADPAATLLAEVLPWTRGLRAVLVTNRADPELDRVLQSTLELAELEHEIALPRRIDALAERIEARRYDLVLSATGFQSHSTSTRLEAAARSAGVPCVRTHRARRLACIRALHRDRPGALRGG